MISVCTIYEHVGYFLCDLLPLQPMLPTIASCSFVQLGAQSGENDMPYVHLDSIMSKRQVGTKVIEEIF